jgi:hypothetical protein
MGFSIEVSGMDELMKKMDKLGEKAQGIASVALFEGARVVADKASEAVQGIATSPFKYAANGEKRKPSPEEKAILTQARHGVAKFNKGISRVDTSVGFQNSGYGAITWNHARTNTRTKYKVNDKGKARHASMGGGTSSKPVPLIANAINSGTSFMEKQPFLRKAFSGSKGAATAAIENKLNEQIENLSLD